MTRIVLMPGLDGSGELFKRFVAEIPSTHNVSIVRYPNNMTKFALFCEYAKTVIAQGEPPIVIAESFSGAVLCEMLRDQVPVRAAIFVASFCVTPRPNLISLSRGIPEAIARASAPLAISLTCLNGVDDAHLKAQILECVKSVSHRTLIGRLNSLRHLKSEPRSSDVPILLLAAKQERLLDQQAKQSLRKAFQHARTVEIDGPHFLLQAQPKACWQAISPFIASRA